MPRTPACWESFPSASASDRERRFTTGVFRDRVVIDCNRSSKLSRSFDSGRTVPSPAGDASTLPFGEILEAAGGATGKSAQVGS